MGPVGSDFFILSVASDLVHKMLGRVESGQLNVSHVQQWLATVKQFALKTVTFKAVQTSEICRVK